jgi:4-amino-4-deoxy-L-arabinose transferase-like glycosyltransferase
MPAVQISSFVVATDAPLLCFLSFALLAYAGLQSATGGRRLGLAAGLGAALGLAFLSKYAAVYFLIGLAMHLAVSREARRAWSPLAVLAAVAVFAAVIAPNVIWNASHGFATVQHTASNAAWGQRAPFNPGGLVSFLVTQVGVFGPIPFGALVAGLVLAARRRALSREDLMLLCFVLPAFLIVSVQALVSRANANWAAVSYLPGAVLVAAWLLRWRARRWLGAAVALQAVLAAGALLAIINPRIIDALGGSNSLKRVRGWSQTAQLITDRAHVEQGDGLSAIAVNERFLYYSLAYYGRDYFGRPGAPPLVYWLRRTAPANQAEASAPLRAPDGARVLTVAYEGWFADEMAGDFARTLGREIDTVSLDSKHRRRIVMFVGEGFRPAPRDPVSGLPRRP